LLQQFFLILTGAKSYQDSLAVDVSIEGGVQVGIFGGSFSASGGYREVDL
jgi:hypothetical protein